MKNYSLCAIDLGNGITRYKLDLNGELVAYFEQLQAAMDYVRKETEGTQLIETEGHFCKGRTIVFVGSYSFLIRCVEEETGRINNAGGKLIATSHDAASATDQELSNGILVYENGFDKEKLPSDLAKKIRYNMSYKDYQTIWQSITWDSDAVKPKYNEVVPEEYGQW